MGSYRALLTQNDPATFTSFYVENIRTEVLKKDPSVEGAPWPVWRIPPYAQANIDPEGVLRSEWRNVKVKGHVDEVLLQLTSLQS